MSRLTEQRVIEAMRAHDGGLGPSLTEEQKHEITYGRPDEPENTEPFNPKRFEEAIEEIGKQLPDILN